MRPKCQSTWSRRHSANFLSASSSPRRMTRRLLSATRPRTLPSQSRFLLAHVHYGGGVRFSRRIDERTQRLVAIEKMLEWAIVPRLAVPVLGIDLELHHARRTEAPRQLLTGQPAEERRELSHPGGTQYLQHRVAEFVGV